MDSSRLDPKAVERISGPSWLPLRPIFEQINEALLNVAPTTVGELTTIYVKYSNPIASKKPYAVVWVKKAAEIVLGLALPEECCSERFVSAPLGCRYAGLTKFIVFASGDDVPGALTMWAKQAYENTCVT